VRTGLWDALGLGIAVLAGAGCAYFYIAATIDEDRALSRSAAFAFLVFGVVAAVFLMRMHL
jgi:hypothetical protein